MIFYKHKELEGKHAFLGASQFRWVNWPDDILEKRFYSKYATQIGTLAHEIAADLIQSRMKLRRTDHRLIELEMYRNYIPKGAFDSDHVLLNMLPFVNDSIGFHMESEVVLYFSPNAFGTTDAIGFNEKELILRIADLKNGITPAKIDQLVIYAALFCLEYRKDPYKIRTELRIYQNQETLLYIPEPDEIKRVMDAIKSKDLLVKQYMERNFR
jgi:hypothetical protein